VCDIKIFVMVILYWHYIGNKVSHEINFKSPKRLMVEKVYNKSNNHGSPKKIF